MRFLEGREAKKTERRGEVRKVSRSRRDAEEEGRKRAPRTLEFR